MIRPKVLHQKQIGRFRLTVNQWPPKEGKDYPITSFQFSHPKGEKDWENLTVYNIQDLIQLYLCAEEAIKFNYSGEKKQSQAVDTAPSEDEVPF